MLRLLAVLQLGFLSAPALVAQETTLSGKLTPILKSHAGEVGFCVKNLKTGEEFAYRADEVMPTASLCKLATMVAAYRRADAGHVDVSQMITLKQSDLVRGSGVLKKHFSAGTQISLRDAIRLMIVYSDNSATNLVTDAIGLKTTSEEMTGLGFPETKIHSKVFKRNTSAFPQRSSKYGLGSTTARETVRLLEQIHRKQCATAESCEAMLKHLSACEDDSRIAAGLPNGTRYANKTGAISNVRCDGGIIFAPNGPIAICVLTNKNKDQSWSSDNAAHRLCAKVGRVVFDHFNPPHKRGAGPTDGPLESGAFGEIVEMLQRTLNQRLSPSPELSVDGDFGPATETAVRNFQASNQLESMGVVNRATWKALGTLVPAATLPEPDVVNAAELPVRSADELFGRPFVTCRGFAILDAATGELLFGDEAEKQREPASTTKIMTAWLVMRLAKTDPSVLNEVMTFSERADLTRGSTAGIKAGEKIVVREALYGLMLPSGNDMSVGLAEHFGARLSPGAADADPLDLFVAAMNHEAKRLGLASTHYLNPHGLSHPKHLTTPLDLSKLARVALTDERFRQYVGTRQHGVKVEGPGGYTRNVVWKNTNRLLAIDGYDGVKTGTTSRAGACLVSTAERGGRRLILTVLGSSGSDARYADARNLYRWAWNQLK